MKKALLLALAGLVVGASLTLLITAQTPHHRDPAVAEVGGDVITDTELREALGFELAKAEQQVYDLKRDKLDEMIDQRLLAQEAAKQNVSVEELLAREVTAKAEPTTEQQVNALFEANKDRFKGKEEELRKQINTYLAQRSEREQRKAYLASLREQANITIYLDAPEPYRAELETEGAPIRGNPNAAITLVKFEDFHCPYCRRVQSTLAQLLLTYGDKVRIVHRDFPLDSLHPQARRSHEAARCAKEQGKFWEYHDALFASPPVSSDDQLKALAEQTGLDMASFDQCLEGGKYKAAVEADVQTGLKLGLTATPSVFVDGRLLSGAQPLENFKKVIDEELKREN